MKIKAISETDLDPQTRQITKFDLDPTNGPAIPSPIMPELQMRPQSLPRSVGVGLDQAARALASGATFGYADELAARMESLRKGTPYTEELQKQQAQDEGIPTAAQLPLEILGGAATGGLPAIRGLATQFGKRVPYYIKYPGIGATAGGVAGSGYAGPGLENRAEGALEGALWGSAIGAVTPVVGRVWRDWWEQFRPTPEGETVKASRKIGEAMKRDLVTPERAMARAQALGPQATMADIGGPNVRELGRSIAGFPGPAKAIAQNLERRAVTQEPRIQETIGRTMSNRGFYETLDEITKRRADAADELYGAARQEAPVFTGEGVLNVIKESPLARAAASRGMRQSDALSAYRKTKIDDLESVSHDFADEVYKQLSSQERVARRTGDAQKAYNIGLVRKELLEEMSQEAPSYRTAVTNYAEESAINDAVESGRRFLRNDPEITERFIKGLTEPEKEAFFVGVSRGMNDLIERTQTGRDATRRIFGNTGMRKKLRAAFPNERAFREFERTMLREAEFAKTRNDILSGSRTAPMQRGMADAATEAAADVATGGGMIPSLMRQARDLVLRQRPPGEEYSRAVGSLLFKPIPQGTPGPLPIEYYLGQGKKVRPRVQPVGSTVGLGVGAGSLLGP